MSARPKTPCFQQLHLFRPRPAKPRWQDFSAEIQRKTLVLLAKLLHTSLPARATALRAEEDSHER